MVGAPIASQRYPDRERRSGHTDRSATVQPDAAEGRPRKEDVTTVNATRTLAVTIEAPFAAVVADLADPAAHPRWAKECFAGDAVPADVPGEFRVQVPLMGGSGRMRVEAVPDLGVVDLYLAPEAAPYGAPVPIRVIRNAEGANVLFTLNRTPGLPQEAWDTGTASMTRKLTSLKTRLEKLENRHDHTVAS